MKQYPIILDVDNVGGDGLVEAHLSHDEGSTEGWRADWTQTEYEIQMLKREIAARGTPVDDVERLARLIIEQYDQDTSLSF